MIIKDCRKKKKSDIMTFEDLDDGDCFEFRTGDYAKYIFIITDEGNAVQLDDGMILLNSDDSLGEREVKLINAEILVSDGVK